MGASFKKRILTALIGVPVIILILLGSKSVMTFVVMLASLIGLYEYYKTVGLLQHRGLCVMGYMASIVISAGLNLPTEVLLVLVFLFMAALFVMMLTEKPAVGVVHIGMLIFGLIYIPYFMSHIIYIRSMAYGNFYVWLVFAGAFLTDTCAYFVGCLLGRHKLCPTISPKKTIEGAIGGLFGGGLAFVVYGVIANSLFGQYLGGARFSLLWLFLLGLIAAVASEIGDLVASSLKRQFNIKDFGNIFPGHGGMLDRCDSIILVAPIIFLFLYNVNILV